jgi:drug/metabolite transporter (DMT)-like permease
MAGMSSTVAGVALACLASCLFNAGIALQASEARQAPHEQGLKLSLIGTLLRRRRWLAGTALNALALPVQTAALLLAPLTAVQPADATGLLLLLFLGSRLLGERVGPVELGAVVAIVGGIAILTAAAPHRAVTQVDAADVLVPLLVVAAVALAPIALRAVVGPDSVIVVLGAGTAFALTAFAIKLAADAIDRSAWSALALIVAVAAAGALAGTLMEQTALQRRPATQVAPVIFVVELLVPVGLAVVVVGEDWAGSKAAIGAALVLIVGGAVALTRAPQVAALLGAER